MEAVLLKLLGEISHHRMTNQW